MYLWIFVVMFFTAVTAQLDTLGRSVDITNSVCTLPLDRGVQCSTEHSVQHRFAFKKYYFDNTLKRCVMFFFYGCEGNANKFTSLKECESICGMEMLEKMPPIPDRSDQGRATLEPPPPFPSE